MPFVSRRAERMAAQRAPPMDLLENRRRPDEVAFVPEVAELILNEQNHECATGLPELSPMVRVRDEAGVELWMAPHPPGPLPNAPPDVPPKYRSKAFYRNGLIICAISLMCLTVFQVYVYILSVYYWPLHFFPLILDKEAFKGAYVFLFNYITLLLGLHPLVMGTWILAGAFCFKHRVLKQFFTRSLYFCAINVIYTVLAILFVSFLPTQEVRNIMQKSLNTYNHTLTHPQREYVPTNEPWDRLQEHQQCCGIEDQNDWSVQKKTPGIPTTDYLVPRSCCMVFKFDLYSGVAKTPDGYLDDIEDCRLSPIPGVTSWKDGCLTNFIHFLQKFCAAFAFLEILTVLFVAVSSYFALKYFILVEHEHGNKDFDYTLAETCIHIWCLGYCIKYEKDRDTGEYTIIGRHLPHRLRRLTQRLGSIFQHEGRKINVHGEDIENTGSNESIEGEPTGNAENDENNGTAEDDKTNTENVEKIQDTN